MPHHELLIKPEAAKHDYGVARILFLVVLTPCHAHESIIRRSRLRHGNVESE
jgi:hypothetical protein